MHLLTSSNTISYERRVYAMLDMIGDIGGFYDAMVLAFSLIMSNYSPNLFLASVISSIFRVAFDDGSGEGGEKVSSSELKNYQRKNKYKD